MHIKKGDMVKVLSGKEKGKSGKILEIDRTKQRARIEGLMVVKRHLKRGKLPSAPEGGIIEKFGSIHVSNLMVIDPSTGEASRVGRKKLEDGRNVRFSKRSGNTLA